MHELARKVKLIAIDVDGVLTDGGIVYGEDDLEIKKFCVKDGQAIAFARRAGIEVAFVTYRESKCVKRRAKDLGVTEIHQGVTRKRECVERIARKYGAKPEEVAYIGDDLVDVPAMKWVGLACAVADAAQEVKDVADYVAKTPGGKGAVREIVDSILKARGVWKQVLDDYYSELE